jgi:hypothetical protein
MILYFEDVIRKLRVSYRSESSSVLKSEPSLNKLYKYRTLYNLQLQPLHLSKAKLNSTRQGHCGDWLCFHL